MNKRLVVITVCMVLVLFAGLDLKHRMSTKQTFTDADIRYGASGTADVYELQGRLKRLGFYTGPVDGDFGYRTLRAVKWFQSEFGLPVDGIVGDRTKVRLWEATRDWRPTAAELPTRAPGAAAGGGGAAAGGGGAAAGGGGGAAAAPAANAGMAAATRHGFSEQDINLMANAVHGESRGEPYVGQVAVAAVILNRVDHPRFPHTVSGVIFQPGAFTAVADGQIWLTPNPTSRKAVLSAINGWDPTGGCIYYFNPATATSSWIWGRPQVKQIGRHIFCK